MRKALCFCGLGGIMALMAGPALAQPGASSGESEPVDSEAVSPPYAEDSNVPDTADPTPGTDAAKAAEKMTEPPKSIQPDAADGSEGGDKPADANPQAEPSAPNPEPPVAAPPPEPPPSPAEPPSGEPPGVGEEPAAKDQPFLPNAPDTLAGHIRLSLGFVGTLPFGNLQSPNKLDDQQVGFHANFGNGIGIDGELSVGVSRYVDVGAYGQFLWMGGNTIDPDDDTQVQKALVGKGATPNIFAAGAFVGYHLVQGTQFDPWISYGLGYRQTGGTGTPGTPVFQGMDFIRLRVGGDWYAAPAFGVGPVVGMDMGLFWKKRVNGVQETINSKSLHFMAFFGVRAIFDYPGH